ncbi:MAG: SCO family protein [Pseudolabrys sp.]|nr:SCO family protein [Pseudolabrys sp.]MBV9955461.1 SCO family protein [Pseudolabrys sp.]
MSPRAARLVLVVTAFLSGLVLFLGVIYFMGGGPGAPPASAIGGPFQLIDQDGRAVTERDLQGKPYLVFFGFTHCPDICPTTLFEVSEVMRALGRDAERAGALFITVDPERDTPEKLKDYLSSFDPRVRGLTGSNEKIEAVEKAYRVYAKKIPTGSGEYTMDHTALVYLLDKQGRFVAPFSLKRKPGEAAAEIRKYL